LLRVGEILGPEGAGDDAAERRLDGNPAHSAGAAARQSGRKSSGSRLVADGQ